MNQNLKHGHDRRQTFIESHIDDSPNDLAGLPNCTLLVKSSVILPPPLTSFLAGVEGGAMTAIEVAYSVTWFRRFCVSFLLSGAVETFFDAYDVLTVVLLKFLDILLLGDVRDDVAGRDMIDADAASVWRTQRKLSGEDDDDHVGGEEVRRLLVSEFQGAGLDFCGLKDKFTRIRLIGRECVSCRIRPLGWRKWARIRPIVGRKWDRIHPMNRQNCRLYNVVHTVNILAFYYFQLSSGSYYFQLLVVPFEEFQHLKNSNI
ncbi:hypothetical protein RJT34_01788 [Clitoria ternatea]|uniref:Uncharacterized protein n=1 Tax=Clitoria ternatea TaxID=43366 RepID=A0AAN9KJP2_CLITE